MLLNYQGSIVAAIMGLLLAAYFANRILSINVSDEKVSNLSDAIRKGSMAFLKRQYSWISIFVIVLAILIPTLTDLGVWGSVSFIGGALFSSLAGFIGMRIATAANGRTTEAARDGGTLKALPVAFRGGAVMGFSVAGLGLLGVGLGYWIFVDLLELENAYDILAAIGLGGSSIALFARVGGGIYTKAADVGADLVGKVEAGIPEDHPLNPATIADNVGDNVGDVAGMGADLFESYVGSIIGTMILGAAMVAGSANFQDDLNGLSPVFLPLVLGAIGIVTSILGTFLVKVKDGGDPHSGLNRGEFASSIAMIASSYFAINFFLPQSWSYDGGVFTSDGVFYAIIIGLVAGLAIGKITEHYTGTGTKPVKSIVEQSITGSATNIIGGLGIGMISTTFPILILAGAVVGAYELAGLYGIAIAAVGMLSNTGIQLAVDAYGPISDNAGGIAEMSELPSEVRQRTDKLDAVGNTTAAIGKGFAIGSAALTALALFSAFKETAGIDIIDVSTPKVMAGLFIGAMLPFLLSALAMGAVGRAAMAMIQEVRRQFKEIPALKKALVILDKNDGKPSDQWTEEERAQFEEAIDSAEYGKCVEISTQSAIKEMVAPGLVAILTPVAIGFGGGPVMLGGLLAGVTASGVLMALFQSNAGGAWDNAKKMVEEGYEMGGVRLS